MKVRNKKTGVIYDIELKSIIYPNTRQGIPEYNLYCSLAELNEEWEDAPEEPKRNWYINEFGTPTKAAFVGRETLYDKCRKNFGNYFETEEEAKKAVEKLKAWKRLKDSKIKFCLDFVMNKIVFTYVIGKNTTVDAVDAERQIFEDMKIVFGGEE